MTAQPIRVFLLLLPLLILLPAPAPAAEPAERHMIAAADVRAANAGLAMLRQGGSAVDAAIAAQAVLSLVEPQSSGIGGGAFLLHFAAGDGRIIAYDGRETAPAAAGPDLFLDQAGRPLPYLEAVVGGRSVGVPGLLRMLELAHDDAGRLPWRDLFQPAIALAEAGFSVSPRLAAQIAADPALAASPAARAYFFGPDGRPPAAGTMLRNPAFAETLRLVAEQGAAAFYQGPVARDIVAAVRGAARPGLLSLEDMAGYRAIRREAVCAPYRIWRVCGMPPPSSGGVAVLQILGLLEPFDLAAEAPEGPRAVHLLAEASRLAFADRDRYLADADFVPVPVDALLARDYLARRSRLIREDASLGIAQAGEPRRGLRRQPQTSGELPSTSHLSVIDSHGNAVAMTTTIEAAFGSRIMARGFLLNNQLTDFAFQPTGPGHNAVANRVEGGKRPRSSMAPTLVFDAEGALLLSLGSPGGSRIIGYVARALLASLDWGLPPQAAFDLPHALNRNGPTELELGRTPPGLTEALLALGHEVRLVETTSGLQGIRVTADGLLGGADRRREGVALGD